MGFLRFIALFFLLLAVPLAGNAAAQNISIGQPNEVSPTILLEQWEAEAAHIERQLEAIVPGIAEIDRMRRQMEDQLAGIEPLRAKAKTERAPLEEQLRALGAAPADDASPEAPQIAEERDRLQTEVARLDTVIKRADQAEVRAEALIARFTQMRRDLFTAQLKARGPSLLKPGAPGAAFDSILRNWRVVLLETSARFERQRMDPELLAGLAVPLLLILGGLILLLRIKGLAVDRLARNVTPETPQSRRVAVGAALTLARLLLPMGAMVLLIAGVMSSDLLGPQGLILLDGVAAAAGVVIGAYALSGAFFSPRTPLLRPSILERCDATASHRWVILLATIVGLDHALVEKGEEMGMAVEGLALLNTVLLCLGGIALWRLMGFVHPPKQPEQAPKAKDDEEAAEPKPESFSILRPVVLFTRVVSRFVAVAAPLLAFGGYYAAARFAFYPLIYSLAVLGACILLYHVVRSLVDQLAVPDGTDAPRERMRLIPLAVGFLLTFAALPVLAVIWGESPDDLLWVWRQIVSGFRVGDVVISPIDFLTFGLVVVIGLAVTQRVKALLRRSVLPLTGLDQGGRDAAAAGVGYLGIVVSALLAFSVTGADLSNLAIVAGALSVGIGFGLQNIVNNFVSGVILLVERPIKAGDWVEIGGVHGTVKNVNVRSTEIETFDRSSMFVPNSDLIAGTVINWTHSNLNGRIIVKIGVDYSSDPRKVERILLEIARAHPMLLRRPAPYVLFRSFGSDALEFEIRGVLRDVNWILNVTSDINYDISRRFAEEGIEVPFKQADISLKNPDEIAQALAAAQMFQGPRPVGQPKKKLEDPGEPA